VQAEDHGGEGGNLSLYEGKTKSPIVRNWIHG